jgi:hypothetical protein
MGAVSFAGLMRDYKDETAFLVRLLAYDESPRSRDVEQRIARAQRDLACVFKATCTAGLLGLLTSFLSQVEFFQSGPAIRLHIVCVLAIADLICMVAFATVFLIYRRRLNGLRDECRQIIGDVAVKWVPASTELLVSPTGSPEPDQMSLQFPN